MTRRHLSRRLEVVFPVPTVRIRRTAPGPQPAPGSREGSTGTPRHNIRCPDDLWGAGIAATAEVPGGLSAALRGYIGALVAGDAPLYPDPTAGPGRP